MNPHSLAYGAEFLGEPDDEIRGARVRRIGLMVDQDGKASITIGQYKFTLGYALQSQHALAHLTGSVESVIAVPLVVSVSETFGQEVASKTPRKQRRD